MIEAKGWAPPGEQAPTDRWAYDWRKGWLPPGVGGSDDDLQWVMDDNFSWGSAPKDVHILTTPAGSEAPIDQINYTPATREIHAPGIKAPREYENFTLMGNGTTPLGTGQRVGRGEDQQPGPDGCFPGEDKITCLNRKLGGADMETMWGPPEKGVVPGKIIQRNNVTGDIRVLGDDPDAKPKEAPRTVSNQRTMPDGSTVTEIYLQDDIIKQQSTGIAPKPIAVLPGDSPAAKAAPNGGLQRAEAPNGTPYLFDPATGRSYTMDGQLIADPGIRQTPGQTAPAGAAPAAGGQRDPRLGSRMTDQPWEDDARRAALEFGVNPDVFVKQILTEAGYNGAESPMGAQGIGQFMPATAAGVAERMRAAGAGNYTADQIRGSSMKTDPKVGLRAAAFHMRELLTANKEDYRKALSAYNSGDPNGDAKFGETRTYLQKILGGAGYDSPMPTSPTAAGASVWGNSPGGPGGNPTTAGGGAGNFFAPPAQQGRGRFHTIEGKNGAIYVYDDETGAIRQATEGNPDDQVVGRRIIQRDPKTGKYTEVYAAPQNQTISQVGPYVVATDPETGKGRVIFESPAEVTISGGNVIIPPGAKARLHDYNSKTGETSVREYGTASRRPQVGDATGTQSPAGTQAQQPHDHADDLATRHPVPGSLDAPQTATAPAESGFQHIYGMPTVISPLDPKYGQAQEAVWAGHPTTPDKSTLMPGWENRPQGTQPPAEAMQPSTLDGWGAPPDEFNDPIFGAGEDAGAWAEQSDQPFPVPFAGTMTAGVGQGVGWGEATPPPDGWTSPLPLEEVVGGGNKWGEAVSMEGSHMGTDLQAYEGTPVLSPVNGTVVSIDEEPEGLGLVVAIQDSAGQVHKLAHLLSADVQIGDQVEAGQPVALVGESGAGATGPHLDYRTETPDGQPLNPEPMMGELAQLPAHPDTVEDPNKPVPGVGMDSWDVGAGEDVWSDLYGGNPIIPNISDAWDQAQAGENRTEIAITPYDKARLDQLQQQIDLQSQQLDAEMQQAQQAHQVAMMNAKTYAQQVAETARHNKVMEQLERKKMQLEREQNALNRANQRLISGTFGQNAQLDVMKTALQNPWLQNLTGMAPGMGTPGWDGSGGVLNDLFRDWNPDTQNWGVPGDWDAARRDAAGIPTQRLPQRDGGGGGLDGGGGRDRWRQQGGGRRGRPVTVGEQMAGGPNNQRGGWGGYAAVDEAPPTPTGDQWQAMTAYEQAAYRTASEMAQPWGATQQNLRKSWGKEGVYQAPQTTQLSAVNANPEEIIRRTQTAEVFGNTPKGYWQDQEKKWGAAGGSSVGQYT